MPTTHDDCACDVPGSSNDVSLTYTDETALRINIDNTDRNGSLDSADIDQTIAFDLTYEGGDNDLTVYEAVEMISTQSFLSIDGWTANDTIKLSESGITEANFMLYTGDGFFETDDALELLLFNAVNAFEDSKGEVQYYFGNVDGNGYLFHDADGDGLTMIVEFLNMDSHKPFLELTVL